MTVQVHFMVGKGGVGKSTMAALLLKEAIKEGKRCRVIQLDRQNNVEFILDGTDYSQYIIPINIATGINHLTLLMNGTILKHVESYIKPFLEDWGLFYGLCMAIDEYIDDLDHLIVDMPPNCMALQFLQFPTAAQSMITTVLTIKNKIKQLVTGSDPILDVVEEMKTVIEMAHPFLDAARFHIITIPTSLGEVECQKNIDFLQQYGFKIYSIIVNMVHGSTGQTCPNCKAMIVAEGSWLAKISAKVKDAINITLPYTPQIMQLTHMVINLLKEVV